MSLGFCMKCGGSLVPQLSDDRVRPVCASCGYIVYQNPAPSVAAIITEHGRVLLVRRAVDPGKGLWGLPGGFIEIGETVEEAVVREIREETGLECVPVDVLAVESFVGGFYGDVVVICYEASFEPGILNPGCDADAVEWFELNGLPELAFTTHERFINRYRRNHAERASI